MDRRRALRYKRYNELYEWLCKDSKCYYCGMPADTKDHIPSLHYIDNVGLEEVIKQGLQLWLVSSCSECNSLLSKDSKTIKENIRYLYNKLQERYDKILNQPMWDEEELEELDEGYLKDYIQLSTDIQCMIHKRLEYMEDLHYDII